MEQALQQPVSEKVLPVKKSVHLCLRQRVLQLSGVWNWDMHAAAVYCSDVMSFPESFAGTKAIIHPDDIAKIEAAVDMMKETAVGFLQFRLITTYGEVKTISGHQISVEESVETASPEFLQEAWTRVLDTICLRKENGFLQLRKELADYTERLTGVGSWLMNSETGQAWYSDNVFRIYGLAPQSLNAHANTFNHFIHEDDRVAVTDAFERAFQLNLPLHVEYRIVLADGETRHVQQITRWLHGSDGQQILGGIFRDLSEEQALAEDLSRLRSDTVLNQQVLRFSEQRCAWAFWYFNPVTRSSTFSENYFRIFGFKQNLVQTHDAFLNLVHHEDRDRVVGWLQKMYTEKDLPEVDFRVVRSDGKIRFVRQSARQITNGDGHPLTVVLVEDMSVLKALEKKLNDLKEGVELDRKVMEMCEISSDLSSFAWLEDGYMFWSDGFYRLLGYKPGALQPLPRMLYKNIHPADLTVFRDAESQLLAGKAHEDIVIRFVGRSGVRLTKIVFRQIQEGRRAAVALVQDISRQSVIREKAIHTRLYSELLTDAVNDLIIFTNTDHTITHWNNVAEEKTWVKKQDALYRNLFEVLPTLNQPEYLEQLRTASAGTEVHRSHVLHCYLPKAHDYRLWPLKNEAGEVKGLLHVIHDTSHQQELQQQLSERLNFIESLVESSVDRIVVLDRHMNYLYWNNAAEKYFGISKQKVIGKNILEVFPAFRNNAGYQEFRKVLKGETVFLPATATENSEEYFESYLTPIKNEAGDVTAVLWIVHDLTREWQLQSEQRRAEQQILRLKDEIAKRATDKYENLYNAIDQGFCIIELLYDAEGMARDFRYLDVNPAFEKQTGIVVEPGKTVRDLVPDVSDTFIEKYAEAHRTGEPIRFVYYAKSIGKWYELHAARIGRLEENQVTVLFSDVTDRKQREANLSFLAKIAGDLMHATTEAHVVQTVGRRISEHLHLDSFNFVEVNESTGDVTVRSNWESQHEPTFRQTFKLSDYTSPDFIQAMRAGEAYRVNDTQSEPATDTARAFAGIQIGSYAAVPYLRNGVWMGYFSVTTRGPREWTTEELELVREVAGRTFPRLERARAEEALRESEERYRLLFETMDQGVQLCELVRDEAGLVYNVIVLQVNPAWQKLTGIDPQVVIGRVVTDWLPGLEQDWFALWEKVVRTGEPERYVYDVKDLGKCFDVFISPVKGDRFIALFTDITERRRAEEALRQSEELYRQKMEQEISQRTKELNESRDLLNSAFQNTSSSIMLLKPVLDSKQHTTDFEYVLTNDQLLKSVDRQSLTGKHLAKEFPGVVSSGLLQTYIVVMETGERWHGEVHVDYDGLNVWAEVYASRVHNYLLVQYVNITDRKHAEWELKKQLELLRYTEYLAHSGNWEYEAETGKFIWSEGMYRLFGVVAKTSVEPEILLDLVHEEDLPLARKLVDIFRNEPNAFEEVLRVGRSQQERSIKLKASLMTSASGAKKLIGIGVDVTGRNVPH